MIVARSAVGDPEKPLQPKITRPLDLAHSHVRPLRRENARDTFWAIMRLGVDIPRRTHVRINALLVSGRCGRSLDGRPAAAAGKYRSRTCRWAPDSLRRTASPLHAARHESQFGYQTSAFAVLQPALRGQLCIGYPSLGRKRCRTAAFAIWCPRSSQISWPPAHRRRAAVVL